MEVSGAARPADSFLRIDVEGATLRSEGVRLFADFGFELPLGQWTCLLGPSGIGKTTLLRALAGFLPPAPAITLAGVTWPAQGQIAYMAQQDLLLPWLNARDNVRLGARLRGHDDATSHAEAQRLLDQVGLANRAEDLPQKLSGGMRQRVALARTLFEQRPLVLMDEPFSQLDALTRLDMQELARALLRGRTVLLVTHDPLEALRVGDRILVLNGIPAAAQAPILPPGDPPRDLATPAIATLYRGILDGLRAHQRAIAS